MAGKIRKNGFTVIEILIVIAIILILMAVIYKPISRKIQAHNIDGDLKKLYGLLQEGRMVAFTQKKELTFGFTSSGACLYDGTTPIKCITLNYPFSLGTGSSIRITNRGTFSQTGSIIYSGTTDLPYTNCIVISNIRVKMGVWNGSQCNPK
ncbi:prepilin-type N-terminal cleavage/methylation domain-containing protein [Persephonella sp.]